MVSATALHRANESFVALLTKEGVLAEYGVQTTEPTVGHGRPQPAIDHETAMPPRVDQVGGDSPRVREAEELPSYRRSDRVVLGGLIDRLGELCEAGWNVGNQGCQCPPSRLKSALLGRLARLVESLQDDESGVDWAARAMIPGDTCTSRPRP